MALPGARARGWAAAAARAAQRRRRVDGGRGSPRPEPASARAALYVHWPYCEKRCSYCNFNKYLPGRVEEAAVRRCLETEARTLLRFSGVRRVESVFFGGGTPSLASPHTVAAVLEAVAQATYLPADSEVTLEANPTSAAGSRLAAFGAAGVNRLSIGLQSLDDTELRLLGRTHSASDALRTLAEARRLFPGRVSVDLMLGLPAQQVRPWLEQLRELLRRCDDHVSLYQLSLERGTALFAQVQQGALPALDPELAADMYQEGRAMLRDAGFRQYEVSNFARNGALSTHNWTYWQCGQYLGVGPGRWRPHPGGPNPDTGARCLDEGGDAVRTRHPEAHPAGRAGAAGRSVGHGASHGRGDHPPALAAVRAPADLGGCVWSERGGERAAGAGSVAVGSQGSAVLLGGSGSAGLSAAHPPASTPRSLASESLPRARCSRILGQARRALRALLPGAVSAPGTNCPSLASLRAVVDSKVMSEPGAGIPHPTSIWGPAGQRVARGWESLFPRSSDCVPLWYQLVNGLWGSFCRELQPSSLPGRGGGGGCRDSYGVQKT